MNKTLRKLLSEPLIHFVGLGVILFIATKEAPENSLATIKITETQKHELIEQFQHQYHYRPTHEEQQKLITNAIVEEALYREGLSYELDKYDPIVKNRVIQKMHFVIEGMATPKQPTVEDLKHFLEQHADQYQSPARYSFEHVFFAKDNLNRRNKNSTKILNALQADQPIESDPFILGDTFEKLSPAEIEQRFGQQFSQALLNTAANIENTSGTDSTQKHWLGPVHTRFGEHFVLLKQYLPPETQSLDKVHHAVYNAWIEEKSFQNQQALKQRIISNYTIEQPLPEPSDVYAMQ